MKQIQGTIEVELDGHETIIAGAGAETLRISELRDGIGLVALFGSGIDRRLTLWHLVPEGDPHQAMDAVNQHIRQQRREGRILQAAEFIVDTQGYHGKRISDIAADWGPALDDGTGENRSPIPVYSPPYDPTLGLLPGITVETSFVDNGRGGLRHSLAVARHQTLPLLRPY